MQIVKSVRKHASSARRKEIIRSYRDSRLTQREFAGRAGISAPTLRNWLKSTTGTTPPQSTQFLALPNLIPKNDSQPAFRLVLPSGLVLEVRQGFTPRELEAWLQRLPLP